ncbi:MAG: flippase [Bacteroidota bacterium]
MKRRIAALLSDTHLRELLAHGVFNFGLRLGAGLLGFLFVVVLGRTLGPNGTGVYVLALAVATVATVLSRLGMPGVLTRFVAAESQAGRWDRVRGVYRKALLVSVVAAVTLTPLVIAGATGARELGWMQPEVARAVQWMALAILPVTVVWVTAGALFGLKAVRAATFVQVAMLHLITLPVFLLLASTGEASPLDAVAGYVTAQTIAAVVGLLVWRRYRKPGPASFEWTTLRRTAGPFFWVSTLMLADGWTAAFALGIWATPSEVGIYNAALRMAMLTSYILNAVNSIAAPKFAALHEAGDTRSLVRTAVGSSRFMTAVAAPLLLGFFLAPTWVMGLFGEGFEAGWIALVIIAAGQFFNVASGSVGSLLAMTGRERLLRNVTMVSVGTNVVLTLTLVPTLGLVGAACGTAIGWVLFNIGCAVMVRRRLGIWVHVFAPMPPALPAHGDAAGADVPPPSSTDPKTDPALDPRPPAVVD